VTWLNRQKIERRKMGDLMQDCAFLSSMTASFSGIF
jgi:hypothetical protein